MTQSINRKKCFPCACTPPKMIALLVAGGVFGTSPVMTKADGPLAPLVPPPFFTFDAQSPHVAEGTVQSGCILRVENEQARCDVPCQVFDMCQVGDEIDALSTAQVLGGDELFALLFSVDRTTVGVADPDPVLRGLGVPYNVKDQATKNQQAGDMYTSTSLFTLDGGPVPGAGRATENSALIRNNYDEGGNDFGADPPTSASGAARARGAAQDNVEALTATGIDVPVLDTVYFSASAGSPSLPNSGANIYVTTAAGGVQLFVSAADLGLSPLDDISGMIVFDNNTNGMFDGQDAILMSLAAGTRGPGGTADILIARPGTGATVFAPGTVFGMGATDNIDGLDFFRCPGPTDAIDCAAQWGIRGPQIPTVSDWGLAVMTLALLVAGTLVFRRSRVVGLAG